MRKSYSYKLIGHGKYERVETEIKEPRTMGFYWIKYYGQWTIGEWHGDHWSCMNDSASLKDYNFEMIYETPIEKTKHMKPHKALATVEEFRAASKLTLNERIKVVER